MTISNTHRHEAHTELCTGCLQVKQTGITLGEALAWKKAIVLRPNIEKLFANDNPDFDRSLLAEKLCFECSLSDYDGNTTNIEVT